MAIYTLNEDGAIALDVAAPIVPAVPEDDKEYASKTYAQITRDQWADYLKRFVPVEDEMIAAYQNPELRAAEIEKSRNLSNSAFSSAAGTASRQAGRYGINLDSDPSYQRRLGLTQAASSVDATNMTRSHINDRDKMLLEGGISTQAGATR